MIQTRSGITLVAVTNTQAGGSAVVITNSQNLGVNVQNSAGWVVGLGAGGALVGTINTISIGAAATTAISNSAGWIVYVANTVAGGDAVTIVNSGGLYAMQSGAWTVAVSNTNPLVSIVNSAGWIVNVANTANRTVIVSNSGGLFAQQSGSWTVAVSNTQTAINIINSAGWVMAQSNTSPLVQVTNSSGWIMAQSNTSPLVQVQNSAGWVISQSNTSGMKVFATLETAQMSSNGVAITAGYAVINASGTNNTIVSAVATRKIRVLAYSIMSNVGNNVQFQSGTGASNLLTGIYFIGSNGGLVAPYNPVGWFESSGNNLLNIKMTATQSIGGVLTYLEI